MKLSAIVGLMVSNHSYKFQLDRFTLSLILVVSHIGHFEPSNGQRITHFRRSIYMFWQSIYIPVDREFNSEQKTYRNLRVKTKDTLQEISKTLNMWSYIGFVGTLCTLDLLYVLQSRSHSFSVNTNH